MVNFKNLTIKKESGDNAGAKFVISPLPKGYGATLGNALRRALLSSVQGAAVYQAKIKGVTHQFSTIKGVKEDVVEILLNLKQVRLKMANDKPEVISLEVTGPREIKAGDLKVPAGVTVVNKDLVIANLADGKTTLEMELLAQKGFGYVPSESQESNKVGVLALDALYSPVTRVSWDVEKTRLGAQSDLDKLSLEIEADGTIDPKDVLLESAAILRDFFEKVGGEVQAPMSQAEAEAPEVKLPIAEVIEEGKRSKNVLLEEIASIPSRTANALKKANILSVKDVLERGEDELSAIKNVGLKSLEGLKEALAKEGFELK